MATFQSFEEIEAWQKARQLTREIYKISGDEVFSRDFGLCNQIRRSSVSIMSNIAEGFERGGTNEFVNYPSIAKGSAGEVRRHLYIAVDQEYIQKETFTVLFDLVSEISRMITGMIKYLRKSGLKGIKYK
jgi:four helix bundle protein